MRDISTIDTSETIARRLRTLHIDARYLLLGKFSRLFLAREAQQRFDGLESFCCFVGHGRSGSTLVGALLNAHPNIAMSNEINALRRLRTGLTVQQLFRVIYLVSRRQARRGSMGGGGYSYDVDYRWQGAIKELRVIGDRKAGATAYEILRYPQLLASLAQKVKLEKKFINVVRNPFDSIATTFHKTVRKSAEAADAHLVREIDNYFARWAAVRLVEETFGPQSVHHLMLEQLIADPLRQLRETCRFLGVEPLEEYLRSCADIVMKIPNESRWSLNWSDRHITMIRQRMKDYRWLGEYADHP